MCTKKSKQEEKSNELYTLLPTVLNEMIEYIEETEQTIDGEWGSCRNLKELIKDKDMPGLYKTLLTLKNGG
tara:strand:+ start:335 stop:547 length:213 start_codon:yes stop_codon:yes gene_type:complete